MNLTVIAEKEHLKNVCLVGHLEKCCRYILVDNNGIQCAKGDREAKAILDARVQYMTAKGDNCEGYEKHNQHQT